MVHRARQVSDQDFFNFDYLLGMDTSNLEDLEEITRDLGNSSKNKIGKGVSH
jgi:protein-tyrosine-phosphatase